VEAYKEIAKLKTQYPGKNILRLPGEIICEIQPASENPEESIAIAVVDHSVPHKHTRTKEKYEVLKGEVTLFIGTDRKLLKKGDSFDIPLGYVHHAEANAAWVKVTSHPAWTKQDHIFIPNVQNHH